MSNVIGLKVVFFTGRLCCEFHFQIDAKDKSLKPETVCWLGDVLGFSFTNYFPIFSLLVRKQREGKNRSVALADRL